MPDGIHDGVAPTPGRYYARREPPGAVDFGEAYWRGAVDPDGARRDRTTERAQHVDDLGHELGFVNALQPGRILDIGCGLGFFLSGVDDAWDKHGVELSDFAVSRARRWGRVVAGSVEDVGYPSAHFDAVVMHHVVEHLERPERTIAEVHRVLAPGGWLVLGAPDFDSGCARRFGPRYRLLHDPSHISMFTNESMHRFLRDNGFLIERVDYPYFDTRHFNEENLLRLLDASLVSPPFYGNFMTFYCRKPAGGMLTAVLQRLGSFAPHELPAVDCAADAAVRLAVAAIEGGGRVLVDAGGRTVWLTELARTQWMELVESSGHHCGFGATGVPQALCGLPAAAEDVTLVFLLDRQMPESASEAWGGCPRIVVCGEARAEIGDGMSGMLRVPLLLGQTAASTEVAIFGALLQEVWSRHVEGCLQ